MSCQIHQQLYQSLIINIGKPPQSPLFQTYNKVIFPRPKKSDLNRHCIRVWNHVYCEFLLPVLLVGI